MAYADATVRDGFLSRLFSNSEKKKAKRANRALYNQQRRELMRMTDRELLGLGISRCEIEAYLHRHHFGS